MVCEPLLSTPSDKRLAGIEASFSSIISAEECLVFFVNFDARAVPFPKLFGTPHLFHSATGKTAAPDHITPQRRSR